MERLRNRCIQFADSLPNDACKAVSSASHNRPGCGTKRPRSCYLAVSMDKPFTLLLAPPERRWVKVLVFFALLFATVAVSVELLPRVSRDLRWLPMVGGVGCSLIVMHFVNRFLSEAAVVTVAEDGLTVQYPASGRKTAVLFASVTACDYASIKGSSLLRLTFRDGKKWFLRADLQLGRFAAMADYVKGAHFRYVHGHSPLPTDARVPAFFKRPLATICLFGLAALLAGITWLTGMPDAGNPGSMLLLAGYVGFVIYAAIWIGGRRSNSAD